MKKTISINIGGNIFHIEEEGYNKLKSYLDSVYTFFSTFEDSTEITDDIENRIAEKFYSELKKNKEAISAKQVDELIASMGTVADFEATLDDEPMAEKQKETKRQEPKESKSGGGESKRLYRNSETKILGGVASGMSHYFSIDPIWTRLLWILFTVAFGIGLVVYIILWIVLPESDELEDEANLKKFFRNPDERVLGGVSSGIASYFGIDTVVVRILFLVSMFLGGSGLILYIILWIITPEAHSVTEKMEMKGEPVTMKGIEKNVKKTLKIEEGEENIFVKILLFPFRLIGLVFEGLAKMMGPVMTFFIEAVRVVFGAAVLLAGFAGMISLIFTLAIMLGLNLSWTGGIGHIDGFPITDFLEPLTPLDTISAFFMAFIPSLGIALLGLTILLKRRIGNAYIALTMVVIWVLAVVGVAFTVPRIIGNFSSDDTYEKEMTFEVTNATPTLRLNELDWRRGEYEGVDLRLRGHSDSTYLVVIRTKAWGSSNKDARKNAAAVEYNVNQKGSDLVFDSKLTFGDGAKFRFQNMDVTLYIPYGKKFKMDQDMDEIIINTLHLDGYYGYQMDGNIWVFNTDGLDCTTCDDDERGRSNTLRNRNDTRNFDFKNFEEVKVSSAFNVKIYQSDEYTVKLKGISRDLEKIYIQQYGDRLTIRSEDDGRSRHSEEVTVYINMPSLKYFRASGETKGLIEDFDDEQIELELSGEADFKVDTDLGKLVIDMSGGAKLNVRGDVEEMTAELSGASYLNSMDLDVKNVTISSSGKTNTQVYADDRLTVNASGESRVRYRGTNDVTINENGGSKMIKD